MKRAGFVILILAVILGSSALAADEPLIIISGDPPQAYYHMTVGGVTSAICTYYFEPKPDITVYELALIVKDIGNMGAVTGTAARHITEYCRAD